MSTIKIFCVMCGGRGTIDSNRDRLRETGNPFMQCPKCKGAHTFTIDKSELQKHHDDYSGLYVRDRKLRDFCGNDEADNDFVNSIVDRVKSELGLS
jgi:hypothetical protein